MKTIITTLVFVVAFLISGCAQPKPYSHVKNQVSKIDIKTACNVNKLGVAAVLKTAKKYNYYAVKRHIEFHRFGMKNSQYIEAIENAISDGAKKIVLVNKKGKATKKRMELKAATVRSCKFALGALQGQLTAEKTYRYAVPGDKLKY